MPAAAALEHEHQHLHGVLDLPEHPPHGPKRRVVLGVDRLQDLTRTAPVEVARGLQHRLGQELVLHPPDPSAIRGEGLISQGTGLGAAGL